MPKSGDFEMRKGNAKRGSGSFEAAIGQAVIELAHEGGGRVWLHRQDCTTPGQSLANGECGGCDPSCYTVMPGEYTVTSAKVLFAFRTYLEAKLNMMTALRLEFTKLDQDELVELLALLEGQLEHEHD